jgi:DNA repair protein RadC
VTTTTKEDAIIAQAMAILESRLRRPEHYIDSPDSAKKLAHLMLTEQPAESFVCMWLDNRHGLLDVQELFKGTFDGASVFPREVARAAIEKNAAAVVLVHNHPSGNPEPSKADQLITAKLKEALALIGTRVLDHLIVGYGEPVSFAERGLL